MVGCVGYRIGPDVLQDRKIPCSYQIRTADCRLRLKCDGTRAETRFRLSAKRTSPFKSAGTSVQSTTGSRCVRISGSNAGYTIRQFPLHFTSCASPCAITFQLDCTTRRYTDYTMPAPTYWQHTSSKWHQVLSQRKHLQTSGALNWLQPKRFVRFIGHIGTFKHSFLM